MMAGRICALGLGALLAGAAAAGAGEPPAQPADARFARAGRLLAAGRLERAYEVFEKLAESHPLRWGARARARMAEIKNLVAARDRVRAESARLREAAEVARGELGPWLLLESARALQEARLYPEAIRDASAIVEKHKRSRFRPAAFLVLARCRRRLGKHAEAVKDYRQIVLSTVKASRAERAATWKELADLLSAMGRADQLCRLLEEHIGRGPEEPGAPGAVERYITSSLVAPREASRAGKVLAGLVKKWPAVSLHPEWVLTAAKVAEFIDRDYSRADKLYRLVLELYPEAAFDLTMIKRGRRGADAGREVILAAIGRAAAKKAGRIKDLEAPKARERGKSPEKALAAVLAALRAGDVKTACGAAAGKLAAELGAKAKRFEFRSFALSDYRILGARETGRGRAEVEYEVAGELGVTRVLKKKAGAVRTGGAWKIAELGL